MDRLRWRWSANTARIVLVSSVLLIVLYTRLYTSGFVSKGTNRSSTPYASSPVLAGCRSLPGVEDILVVLKTGATEALSKLPVHFTTTLHCIPHYLIISDYAETINDNALVDVLQSVNEDIRRTVPEFELYNRLSESGRGALQSDEVSRWALTPNTNQGKDNPAWKLDKWKFLPMVESASNYKPDARWYVFLEADSYICWPNLLAWLALYNSDEPHYLGSQMQIGSTVFAYGGAGYAISQPAMRKVVEYRRAHLTELEEYTKNNWAGDEVLGHALLQAGVSLQWTYPNTQNELPGRIDYTSLAYGKRIWCYAPIGWHHMDPTDIESMYTFDRAWNYTERPLLHQDVFREHILPQIQQADQRDDWDNESGTPYMPTLSGEVVPSREFCHSVCVLQSDCVQYTLREGVCHTSTSVLLGRPAKLASNPALLEAMGGRTHSGWLLDRVHKFHEEIEPCQEGPWILP